MARIAAGMSGTRGGRGGRGSRAGGRGGGEGSSSAALQRQSQVFVRNLPVEFLEPDIENLFGEFGPIKRVDLIKTMDDEGIKTSRGFGFVRFALEEDAGKAAAALHGKFVNGRKLCCEIALKKGAKRETASPETPPNGEAAKPIIGAKKLNGAGAAAQAASVNGLNGDKAVPQPNEDESDEGEDDAEEAPAAVIASTKPETAKAAAGKKAGIAAASPASSSAAAAADDGDNDDDGGKGDAPAAASAADMPIEARTVLIFGVSPDLNKKQLYKRARKISGLESLEIEANGSSFLPAGNIGRAVCRSRDDARKLASKLDGHTIHEHTVRLRHLRDVVTVADARQRKQLRLIVRNLSFDVTEEVLAAAFVVFGPLSEVHIPTVEVTFERKDRRTGQAETVTKRKSRGFGFVQFACRTDAAEVVKNHGVMTIGERQVAVDFSVSKDRFESLKQANSASETAATAGAVSAGEAAPAAAAGGAGAAAAAAVDGDDENDMTPGEAGDDDEDEEEGVDGSDGDESDTGSAGGDGSGDDDDDDGSEENEEDDADGKKSAAAATAKGAKGIGAERAAATAAIAAAKAKVKVKEAAVPHASDIGQGRTLFVRNMPFDAEEHDLRGLFEPYGRVRQALLVMNRDTGLPRGTAFVKFATAAEADRCLAAAGATPGAAAVPVAPAAGAGAAAGGKEGVSKGAASFATGAAGAAGGTLMLLGRELHVARAVEREEAGRLALAASGRPRPGRRDRRCLYLADEGLLQEDSAAAEGAPKADLDKRRKARQEKKQKLKNPLFFVSPTRLSVRNVARHVDDAALKKLFATGARLGLKEKKATAADARALMMAQGSDDDLTPGGSGGGGGAKGLTAEVPPLGPKSIVTARLIRDLDRKPSKDDESQQAPTKGYGFVEFASHVHALAALRHLNNNPEYAKFARGAGVAKGETPRLMVEFAVEDIKKIRLQEERRRRQEKRKEDLASLGLRPDGRPVVVAAAGRGGDGAEGGDAPKKMSRGSRQRERKRQQREAGGDDDAVASSGGTSAAVGANGAGKRALVAGKGRARPDKAAVGPAAAAAAAVAAAAGAAGAGQKRRREEQDPEASLVVDAEAERASAGSGAATAAASRRKKGKQRMLRPDAEDKAVERLEEAYIRKVEGPPPGKGGGGGRGGGGKTKREAAEGGATAGEAEAAAASRAGKRRWYEG